jgi:hypothetical protein
MSLQLKRDISRDIELRFTTHLPLELYSQKAAIKLEIKPYLQPFEINLAISEVKALLNNNDIVNRLPGYYFVKTDLPDSFLRNGCRNFHCLKLDKRSSTLDFFSKNSFVSSGS